MGKLVVTEFVTLDGVAQAPGGSDEDREGDFAFRGWQAPLLDAQSGRALFEQAQSMDALLLGRRTYENFAAYWPTAPKEMPYTDLLNGVPKYAASRTLTEPLSWSGSVVLAGEPIDAVTALKVRHAEIHVIGSLGLLQSLLRAEIVDQLNLWVFPLLLGSGKRAFGAGTVPTALRLAESVTYPNGAVNLVFAHDGRPSYGDMTIDEPDRGRPDPLGEAPERG